jgi:hypothetical protein
MGNAPSMASDLRQTVSMLKSSRHELKHLLMVGIEAIVVPVFFGVTELRDRHSQNGKSY